MKVAFKRRGGYDDYVGLQFATVDPKANKMLSWPQKCKEIFAYELATVAEQKPKRFRFLITLANSIERRLNAEATQDFLNQIEKEMGFSKSRVWNVTDSAPVNVQALLIDCSGRWLKTSPLFHFMLLLARNGSNHMVGRNWKTTLAMFRRAGKVFQATDIPQFLITRDVVPFIVSRKGNLPTVAWDDNMKPYLTKFNGFQRGLGICSWTENIKKVGVI